MFAVAMGTFGIAPAWGWEPVPLDPNARTAVTRVLDVGRSWTYQARVALAEAPAAACAAIGARQNRSVLYSDAWLGVFNDGVARTPSEMLAVALAARAQNLPVRVTITSWNDDCLIVDLRTCVDAAACALPPAP
jgi:hypothetical protein